MNLIDVQSAKHFLLTETQHAAGGFGKNQGDPPDIFHSYMGLATLSIMGHPDLKPVHSTACISLDALDYLKSIHG
jgi:geranylgeranyl transferase type-1 subunit beta